MKIRYTNSSMLLLLLFLMTINIPYLSQSSNNLIRLLIEIIITFLLIRESDINRIMVNTMFIAAFAGWMTLSTFLVMHFTTRTLTAFVTGYAYILLFAVCWHITTKKGHEYLYLKLFQFLKYVLILMDIVVLGTLGKGIGGTAVLGLFLLGNKFVVSYYHMMFLALYLMIYQKMDKIFCLLLAESMLVCIVAKCMTGVVGIITLVLVYVISMNKGMGKLILTSPFFYVFFMFTVSFLIAGSDFLLKNSQFQTIIEQYFHKDMTLTGRLIMYELSILAIKKRPYLGWGINCTTVEDKLGWGNAQNGLLKMTLDFGYIGIFLFVFTLIIVFWRLRKVSENTGMVAFLYGMAVCSMVEINLSYVYFLGLAIVYSEKNKTEQTLLSEKESLTDKEKMLLSAT